jgi:hypothetical protein
MLEVEEAVVTGMTTVLAQEGQAAPAVVGLAVVKLTVETLLL